jgi:DNA-binding MarR family transcriptional regulator
MGGVSQSDAPRPAPRGLTPAEQQVWRSYLSMTRLVTDHLERQLQQDSQMPHAYYELLVRLSEAPDRTLRMSELAEASLSSRSRISHAVARLEANGWIERRGCEEDKRGAWAALTDAGFQALDTAAQGHVEAVRAALIDVLTPEQLGSLGEISEAVLDRIPGSQRLRS